MADRLHLHLHLPGARLLRLPCLGGYCCPICLAGSLRAFGFGNMLEDDDHQSKRDFIGSFLLKPKHAKKMGDVFLPASPDNV